MLRILAAVALLFAGCSESPTPPAQAPATSPSQGSILTLDEFALRFAEATEDRLEVTAPNKFHVTPRSENVRPYGDVVVLRLVKADEGALKAAAHVLEAMSAASGELRAEVPESVTFAAFEDRTGARGYIRIEHLIEAADGGRPEDLLNRIVYDY